MTVWHYLLKLSLHIFQNWYELQLQQIQQWLEKRPEFSLHAAQVQASRGLTDVRTEILMYDCTMYCTSLSLSLSPSPVSPSPFSLPLVGAS